jgi:hypothetical protein
MQKRLRRFRADETIANMIDVGVAHITCGIVREKCRSPSTHNITRLPLWVDNCRKIPISLKMDEKANEEHKLVLSPTYPMASPLKKF